MEVLTAQGEILICNKKENADLFWAARGSDQGFFAVVVKYWGRTILARSLFQHLVLFNAIDAYEEIPDFVFKANSATPEEGTGVAVASFYPERYTPSDSNGVQDRS